VGDQSAYPNDHDARHVSERLDRIQSACGCGDRFNGRPLRHGRFQLGRGNLYVVDPLGGANGDCTIWELPSGSNTLVVLAAFDGTNNGSEPSGSRLLNIGARPGRPRPGHKLRNGTTSSAHLIVRRSSRPRCLLGRTAYRAQPSSDNAGLGTETITSCDEIKI
jgi:hypothetical protein